jgi:hypothetical protein
MRILVDIAGGTFELISISAFLTTIIAGFALAAGHF